MNRDIARRTVLVRRDAKTDNPFERPRESFRIPDVVGWMCENRGAIVRAVLVLVRAWVSAGRPEDREVQRGGFESWCRVIGGILRYAQLGGLAGALRASFERDAHAEDYPFFVRMWLEEYQGKEANALALGQLAAKHGLYEEALANKRTPLGLGRVMAARVLKPLVGKVIAGYRIEVAPGQLNGCTAYRLTRTSEGEE